MTVGAYIAGISFLSWISEATYIEERAKWMSIINWTSLVRSVAAVGSAYLIQEVGLAYVFIGSALFMFLLTLATTRVTYSLRRIQ